MSIKSILSSQEHDDPMAYIHFTAEGEVTFKSILFVPNSAPRGLFDEYGSKKSDFIKVGQKSVWVWFCGKGKKTPKVTWVLSALVIQLYVRRVFITDDFHDMMPKYLNFVKGVVSIINLAFNFFFSVSNTA